MSNIAKIYKVKKSSISGVIPSGKTDDNYELLKVFGGGNSSIDSSSVINRVKPDEVQSFNKGDIVVVEVDTDDELIGANKYIVLPQYYIQFSSIETGNFIEGEDPSSFYKLRYGISSEWELIFNTSSLFFRTEGDISSENRNVSTGIQGDAQRRLTGNLATMQGSEYVLGSFIFHGNRNFVNRERNGSHEFSQHIGYDSSRQSPVSNEVRPINTLIRVFKLKENIQ